MPLISGTPSSDTLNSRAGNDTVSGGDGSDTLVLSGRLRDYKVAIASGVGTVTDSVAGRDGTDTLQGIEHLRFSDVGINTGVKGVAASVSTATLQRVIELYVAFFNRTPDADGLEYWLTQARGGMSLNAIAEAFYGAGAQYTALTGFSPAMTHTDFVNVVYRNVLGRSEGADAEGLAYWAGELASGRASRGSLVSTILDSAHTFKGHATWGWVADLLDNKVSVARQVAVDWGLNALTPQAAVSQGMAIAQAVTASDTKAALALAEVPVGALSLGAIGVKDVRLVTNYRYFDKQAYYLLDGTLTTNSAYGGGYPLLAAGDLNRDGHADLLFGFLTWNNDFAKYPLKEQFVKTHLLAALYDPATGGYVFDPSITKSLPPMYWTQHAVIDDFNADGYADVFVAGTGPDQGDPRGEMPVLGLGSASGLVDASHWLPRIHAYTHQSVVADFNEDGKSDFFLLNNPWINVATADALKKQTGIDHPYTDHASLTLSTAGGWTQATVSNSYINPPDGSFVSYSSAAVGDFNGDGHLDLALSGGNFGPLAYKVLFLRGDGRGGFREDGQIAAKPFGDGNVGSSLTPYDFDGDGMDEVLLASTLHAGAAQPWTGAKLQVFDRNASSGAWSEVTDRYVPTTDQANGESGAWIKTVHFIDIDRDGDKDMVVSTIQGPDDHRSGHVMPRLLINTNGYFVPQDLAAFPVERLDGLGGLIPLVKPEGVTLIGASNWVGPNGLNIYEASLLP